MGLKELAFVCCSTLACILLLVIISDGPPSSWRFSCIPDQTGKVVIVTGANSGTGFHFSRHMAAQGATIVMACRNPTRCEDSAKSIKSEYPEAKISTFQLDLASLKSVSNFVDNFKKHFDRLDILVNNAGVMGQLYNQTEDHFETHIATNHLGPFALTSQLFPILLASSNLPNPSTHAIAPARIITVSSFMERTALLDPNVMDVDDLHFQNRPFTPRRGYVASKIANIYFFKELHQRIQEKDLNVFSIGVHPGWCKTELTHNMDDRNEEKVWINFMTEIFAQSAEMGAAPLLYAATSEEVESGVYYGPSSFMGTVGWPKKGTILPRNLNQREHKKLWNKSIQLTNQKQFL